MRIDGSHGFPTYIAGSLEALEKARGQRRTPGWTSIDSEASRTTQARVVALNDLIEGRAQGRLNNQEISSSGSVAGGERGEGKQGLQFVTVASLVYDLAKQAGLGHEVPTDWFLQDIRD